MLAASAPTLVFVAPAFGALLALTKGHNVFCLQCFQNGVVDCGALGQGTRRSKFQFTEPSPRCFCWTDKVLVTNDVRQERSCDP